MKTRRKPTFKWIRKPGIQVEQKTKNIRDPSGAENEDATSIQVEEKMNPKQRLRWSRKRNQDQHSSGVENNNETSKDETDSRAE